MFYVIHFEKISTYEFSFLNPSQMIVDMLFVKHLKKILNNIVKCVNKC